MDHSRRQKYEDKQSKNSILEKENDFEPISISINDMDKFKKTNWQRKENLQKSLGTIGRIR